MSYVVRQLFRSLLVIVGVSVFVFVVTHLIGDPAKLILPLDASQEQYLRARQQMGLDRPLWEQFAEYTGNLLRGDFGDSIWQRRPALPLALGHLWPTVQLGLAAVSLAVVLGVPAGILAASRPNSALDRAITMVSLFGVSIANFWLSLMLILVFAVQLRWLYTSGYGTWQHLVLPVIAAAALPFGRVTQMSRTAMIEELHKPYVTVAHAKGLSPTVVSRRHVLRNAAIPIVTMAGYELGRIMAGFIVVIEVVFAWPGLGQLTYNALTRHDFPLIQACIFVIALSIVVINIVIDLCYAVLDPRIRLT